MKKLIITLVVCLLVTFIAVPAAAEVRVGKFQVDILPGNYVEWDPAQNDGFQETWFAYPQGDNQGIEPPPTWWNEWWWNDPWLQPGGKWIRLTFDYQLLDPAVPGDVFVTINWTNGGWIGGEAQGPPTWDNSTDPELFIERLSDSGVDWSFHLDPDSTNPELNSWTSGVYWLPIEYNPEWVSVDVQGGNVGILNGVIEHECVPEPMTLALLGLGGLLLRRRKSA